MSGPATPAADNLFPRALRAGITRSELSLRTIVDRLDERGVRVSSATLSQWQTGRSQPERTTSIAVLRELEEILALPPASLMNLVGPPRPRGAGARAAAPLLAPGLDLTAATPLLSEVDYSQDGFLSRLSMHSQLRIGPDRRCASHKLLLVVRAERGGVDRLVIASSGQAPGDPPSVVRPLRNCHVAGYGEDPELGHRLTELRFPPLRRGETACLQWEMREPASVGPPVDHAYGYARRALSNHLLQVTFSQHAIPKNLVADSGDGRPRVTRLDRSRTAHTIRQHRGSGEISLRWDWDPVS